LYQHIFQRLAGRLMDRRATGISRHYLSQQGNVEVDGHPLRCHKRLFVSLVELRAPEMPQVWNGVYSLRRETVIPVDLSPMFVVHLVAFLWKHPPNLAGPELSHSCLVMNRMKFGCRRLSTTRKRRIRPLYSRTSTLAIRPARLGCRRYSSSPRRPCHRRRPAGARTATAPRERRSWRNNPMKPGAAARR
jgi:hypothetical protein